MEIRVRRDHVPYDVWEKQGYLKTTEGNVVHYGFIEAFIEELGMKYNILEIAFDRWGAMIVATAPSIFSVDFSLSGFRLPAGSVRTWMLSIIQRLFLWQFHQRQAGE